jgi:hypothetical protein
MGARKTVGKHGGKERAGENEWESFGGRNWAGKLRRWHCRWHSLGTVSPPSRKLCRGLKLCRVWLSTQWKVCQRLKLCRGRPSTQWKVCRWLKLCRGMPSAQTPLCRRCFWGARVEDLCANDPDNLPSAQVLAVGPLSTCVRIC